MEKNGKLISDLKFAIIYGDDEVDGKSQDGILERVEKEKDDTAHYFYAKDFLKTHFLDKGVLREKEDVNSIFFEMQNMSHIVFAENTSVITHKTGIFYMPSKLSEKQKLTLLDFKNQLNNENYNITVLYDLYRTEDGILMGNQQVGSPIILNKFCLNQDKTLTNSESSNNDDKSER